MYRDPFRPGGANLLVLCDCYKPDPDEPLGLGDAIPTNSRKACSAVMEAVGDAEPWFGIEQEYTLFEPDGVTPYGWPVGGEHGHWYGGGESLVSEWPLDRGKISMEPFVTGDEDQTMWGNVIRKFFINSRGLSLRIADRSALSVSLNDDAESGEARAGALCLEASFNQFPYYYHRYEHDYGDGGDGYYDYYCYCYCYYYYCYCCCYYYCSHSCYYTTAVAAAAAEHY